MKAVALGGGRCFVIGEVGLTHDGSLGQAHAFVDAIAAGHRAARSITAYLVEQADNLPDIVLNFFPGFHYPFNFPAF